MDVIFQEQMMNYLGENTYDPIYQEEVTELAIPESMLPIGQIVDCSGCLCIRSKEVGTGAVTVAGEIKACVLYQPEDNGPIQKVEKEIGFTVKKEISELEPEHFVFYQGWIKRIDAKMLGSRRLLIRGNIGSRFTAYYPTSFAVSVPQNAPKTLQLLKNSYEMMLPGCCGEKEFRMNEEAVLPEAAAGISEILKTSVAFQITETKVVGDKAVFKGNVLLHLLYSSSAETLHGFDTQLPFSQYVEMNGESEDSDVRIGIQMLSCEIETDGQEGSKRLLLNLNALAQAVVYTKQRMELYEDAYVTKGILQEQWQDVSVQARLDSQSVSIGGELSVPAMTEKVIDASVYPDQPMIRREKNSVKVIMPVWANVLYLDKDGIIRGKETKGEITYDNLLAQSASCTAQGMVYEQPVCLASYDTITVRMAAQIMIDSYMGSRMRTIKSVVIEQPEKKGAERPSLIARKAGKESVWDIAKLYGSTVEAICEANNLTAGVVQEGAILLIPMQ